MRFFWRLAVYAVRQGIIPGFCLQSSLREGIIPGFCPRAGLREGFRALGVGRGQF
ncbi:hypothetical protein R80B4_00803 [Fibrobacteres bacterium R8-0-B4]